MDAPTNTHPDLLLPRLLRRWERRRRLRQLLRHGGRWTFALGLLWLAWLLLASLGWLRPETGGWTFYLAAVVIGGGLLVGVARVLWPAVPLTTIARRLETGHPDARHEPISGAVALIDQQEGAAWMRRRAAALASQWLADHQRLGLPSRSMWPAWAILMILSGVVVALSSSAAGEQAARLLRPWHASSMAARYEILVDAASEQRLGEGQPWSLRARCRPAPPAARLEILRDDGRRRLIDLAVNGEYLGHTWPALSSGFRYRVLVEDDRSPWYRVIVGTTLRLQHLRRTIVAPDYTELPSRPWSGTSITVLAGSQLRVDCEVDGSVRSAWLEDGNGQRHALALSGRQVTGELVLEADTELVLMLLDGQGNRHQAAMPWRITVRADEPPTVALEAVSDATTIPVDAPVALRYQAVDDVALRELTLRLRYDDGSESDRRLDPTTTQSGGQVTVLPRMLGLTAGAGLAVQLRAVDRGGQPATSEWIAFTCAGDADLQRQRLRRWLQEHEALLMRAAVACEGERWQWLRLRDGWYAPDDDAFAAAVRLLTERAVHQLAPVREHLQRQPPLLVLPADQAERLALIGLLQQQHWVPLQQAWWRREQGQLADGRTELCRRMLASLRQSAQVLRAQVQALRLARDRLGLDAALSTVTAYHDLLDPLREAETSAWLWQTGGWQGGLQASAWRGRQADGRPVWQGHLEPRLVDHGVPRIGKEGWFMRYEGQVRLAPGTTWLGLRCDDGGRVILAERDLFGDDAWRDQGPTLYRSQLAGRSGWHDIIIEHFQGGGGSELTVLAGSDGEALTTVAADAWRNRDGDWEDRSTRLAAMSTPTADAAARPPVPAALAAAIDQLSWVNQREGRQLVKLRDQLVREWQDGASAARAQHILRVLSNELRSDGERLEKQVAEQLGRQTADACRDPVLQPAWSLVREADADLQEQARWQWRMTVLQRHDDLLRDARALTTDDLLALLDMSRICLDACHRSDTGEAVAWEAVRDVLLVAADQQYGLLLDEIAELRQGQERWRLLGQDQLMAVAAGRLATMERLGIVPALRGAQVPTATPPSQAPAPTRLAEHVVEIGLSSGERRPRFAQSLRLRLQVLPVVMRVVADGYIDSSAADEQRRIAEAFDQLVRDPQAGTDEMLMILVGRQHGLQDAIHEGETILDHGQPEARLAALFNEWGVGRLTTNEVLGWLRALSPAQSPQEASDPATFAAAAAAWDDLDVMGQNMAQSSGEWCARMAEAGAAFRSAVNELRSAQPAIGSVLDRVAFSSRLRDERLATAVQQGHRGGAMHLADWLGLLVDDRAQMLAMLGELASLVDDAHERSAPAAGQVRALAADLEQVITATDAMTARLQTAVRRQLVAAQAIAAAARDGLGRAADTRLGEERQRRLALVRADSDDLSAVAPLAQARLGMTQAGGLDHQWYWLSTMAELLLAAWETPYDDADPVLRDELRRDTALVFRRLPSLVTRTVHLLADDQLTDHQRRLAAAGSVPSIMQHMRALAELDLPEPHLVAQQCHDLMRGRLRVPVLPATMTGSMGEDDDGRVAVGANRLAEDSLPIDRLRVPDAVLRSFGEQQQQAIRSYFTRLAEERWR